MSLYEQWVCHGEIHDTGLSSLLTHVVRPQITYQDERIGDYHQIVLDVGCSDFADQVVDWDDIIETCIEEKPNAMDKFFFELLKYVDRELW